MALKTQEWPNMVDQVISKDIGSLLSGPRAASTLLQWTSGGAGDNTTKTGISFDRETIGTAPNGSIPESMVADVLYQATLASGSSLSIAITINDSADNSTFAAFTTESSVVVATGPSGGGQVTGYHRLKSNLTAARRYLRVDFVPVLSRGATDTANAWACAVTGGFDRNPAP